MGNPRKTRRAGRIIGSVINAVQEIRTNEAVVGGLVNKDLPINWNLALGADVWPLARLGYSLGNWRHNL